MKHRPTKAKSAPAAAKWPKGIKTVEIPMYAGLVCLATNLEDWVAMCRYVGVKPDDDGTWCGISWNLRHETTKERVYLVGVLDDNPTTLIHELAHTTFQLHADVGLDLDHENGNCESFTYLQGYLYDELKDYVGAQDVLYSQAITEPVTRLDADRPLAFESVFEVRFFVNAAGKLSCAADGDLSDYDANKQMADALATLAEHLVLAENVVPRTTATQ
jgi:hypothetical protein